MFIAFESNGVKVTVHVQTASYWLSPTLAIASIVESLFDATQHILQPQLPKFEILFENTMKNFQLKFD